MSAFHAAARVMAHCAPGEVSGPDPVRIRDIAVLRFAAEKTVAAGQFEEVVRLHNVIERKEKQLRTVKREPAFDKAASASLGAYLAGKAGAS